MPDFCERRVCKIYKAFLHEKKSLEFPYFLCEFCKLELVDSVMPVVDKTI